MGATSGFIGAAHQNRPENPAGLDINKIEAKRLRVDLGQAGLGGPLRQKP
jgi:hypothetical protein